MHELLVHFSELLEIVLEELDLLLLRRAAAQSIAAGRYGRVVWRARAIELRARTLKQKKEPLQANYNEILVWVEWAIR